MGTDQGRMLLFEGLLNTHNFVIIKLFACRFLPCIINSQYLTSMFNKYVKCRATCIVLNASHCITTNLCIKLGLNKIID